MRVAEVLAQSRRRDHDEGDGFYLLLVCTRKASDCSLSQPPHSTCTSAIIESYKSNPLIILSMRDGADKISVYPDLMVLATIDQYDGALCASRAYSQSNAGLGNWSEELGYHLYLDLRLAGSPKYSLPVDSTPSHQFVEHY